MSVPIQRQPLDGELAVVRDRAEQLVGENLDGTDETVGRARENDIRRQRDESVDRLRVAGTQDGISVTVHDCNARDENAPWNTVDAVTPAAFAVEYGEYTELSAHNNFLAAAQRVRWVQNRGKGRTL